MSKIQQNTLPTLADLYGDIEVKERANALNILLNQPPKKEWLKDHPTAKNIKGQPIKYIPIERIEFLLTRIFIKWRVEVLTIQLIGNSVVVTVRLHYLNPLDNSWEWTDGIGAAPLQTDRGAGATDFNSLKSASVQIAAPAAESYAIKDAAEKLGKLFGKDVNRADAISYDILAKNFGRGERMEKILTAIEVTETPFKEEMF